MNKHTLAPRSRMQNTCLLLASLGLSPPSLADIFSEGHPDLIATTVQPSPVAPNSWRGIFRINCDFSHAAYDDPLVFPGQPDRAHYHHF